MNSLPYHRRIKVVVMDMWRPYRDAVYEVLPGAMIVVDKFHVIKGVNNALTFYRKEFQKPSIEQTEIGGVFAKYSPKTPANGRSLFLHAQLRKGWA